MTHARDSSRPKIFPPSIRIVDMGCVPAREFHLEDCHSALNNFYSNNLKIWQRCLDDSIERVPFQTAFPSLTLPTLTESVKGPITPPRLRETIGLFKTIAWGFSTSSLQNLEELAVLLQADVLVRYEVLQLFYYLFHYRFFPDKLKSAVQSGIPQLSAKMLKFNVYETTSVQIYLISVVLLRQTTPDPKYIRNIHHWILDAFECLTERSDLIGILAFLIARKDDVLVKYRVSDAICGNIKQLSILNLALFMEYLSLFEEVEISLFAAVLSANPLKYIHLPSFLRSLSRLLGNQERLKLFFDHYNAEKDTETFLKVCNHTLSDLEFDKKTSTAQSLFNPILTQLTPTELNFEKSIEGFWTLFQYTEKLRVSDATFISSYTTLLIAQEVASLSLKHPYKMLEILIFHYCRNYGQPIYEELLVKYILHVINNVKYCKNQLKKISHMLLQCCRCHPTIRECALTEVEKAILDTSNDTFEALKYISISLKENTVLNDSTQIQTMIQRLSRVFSLSAEISPYDLRTVLQECEYIAEDCIGLSGRREEDGPIEESTDFTMCPTVILEAIRQTVNHHKIILEEGSLMSNAHFLDEWRIRSISLDNFANSLFFQLLFMQTTQKPLCCFILTEFIKFLRGDLQFSFYDSWSCIEASIMKSALSRFRSPDRVLLEYFEDVMNSYWVQYFFLKSRISTESFSKVLSQIYFTDLGNVEGASLYTGVVLLSRTFIKKYAMKKAQMILSFLHALSHACAHLETRPSTRYIGIPGLPKLAGSDFGEELVDLDNALLSISVESLPKQVSEFLIHHDSWSYSFHASQKNLGELVKMERDWPMLPDMEHKGVFLFSGSRCGFHH